MLGRGYVDVFIGATIGGERLDEFASEGMIEFLSGFTKLGLNLSISLQKIGYNSTLDGCPLDLSIPAGTSP